MPQQFYMRFMRLPLILRIFILALIVILLSSIFIHLLEPQTFPTIFHGLWWAIITTSTVGYGDLVPVTFQGRLLAAVLILLGIGFVTSYFATLASTTVLKQKAYTNGQVSFKGGQHMIIIGWNERSREIMKNITSLNKSQNLVLIDETLEKNPSTFSNLHFIKGRPHIDEVLLKANVHMATKVLITADQNKNELEADMHSILTLLTIKGLNPNVYCIVEILTTEQMTNAKRAGANEIIQTNLLTSSVMIDYLFENKLNPPSQSSVKRP